MTPPPFWKLSPSPPPLLLLLLQQDESGSKQEASVHLQRLHQSEAANQLHVCVCVLLEMKVAECGAEHLLLLLQPTKAAGWLCCSGSAAPWPTSRGQLRPSGWLQSSTDSSIFSEGLLVR